MNEVYYSLLSLVQSITGFLDLLIEFSKAENPEISTLEKPIADLITELQHTQGKMKGGNNELHRRIS